MAQETVIHRIDAELGTGQPGSVLVPSDLAIDGIDELLKVFVAYSVAEWSGYFTVILAGRTGPDLHGADRRRGVAGADRPGAVRCAGLKNSGTGRAPANMLVNSSMAFWLPVSRPAVAASAAAGRSRACARRP